MLFDNDETVFNRIMNRNDEQKPKMFIDANNGKMADNDKRRLKGGIIILVSAIAVGLIALFATKMIAPKEDQNDATAYVFEVMEEEV